MAVVHHTTSDKVKSSCSPLGLGQRWAASSGASVNSSVSVTKCRRQVVGTHVTAEGNPPQQADNLTHSVTDSARAAIEGLAAQPRTQFVADAARDAMSTAEPGRFHRRRRHRAGTYRP